MTKSESDGGNIREYIEDWEGQIGDDFERSIEDSLNKNPDQGVKEAERIFHDDFLRPMLLDWAAKYTGRGSGKFDMDWNDHSFFKAYDGKYSGAKFDDFIQTAFDRAQEKVQPVDKENVNLQIIDWADSHRENERLEIDRDVQKIYGLGRSYVGTRPLIREGKSLRTVQTMTKASLKYGFKETRFSEEE